jgi:hypothetical protein
MDLQQAGTNLAFKNEKCECERFTEINICGLGVVLVNRLMKNWEQNTHYAMFHDLLACPFVAHVQ